MDCLALYVAGGLALAEQLIFGTGDSLPHISGDRRRGCAVVTGVSQKKKNTPYTNAAYKNTMRMTSQ